MKLSHSYSRDTSSSNVIIIINLSNYIVSATVGTHQKYDVVFVQNLPNNSEDRLVPFLLFFSQNVFQVAHLNKPGYMCFATAWWASENDDDLQYKIQYGQLKNFLHYCRFHKIIASSLTKESSFKIKSFIPMTCLLVFVIKHRTHCS